MDNFHSIAAFLELLDGRNEVVSVAHRGAHVWFSLLPFVVDTNARHCHQILLTCGSMSLDYSENFPPAAVTAVAHCAAMLDTTAP